MIVQNEKLPTQLTRLFVCLYLRMSSDEQTTSIAIQRKRCREYAASRNWVIVQEYVDEGKSGSKDFGKRVQFHQMIADSVAGNWSAVLVLDSSRFGRLDSLDGAPAKNTLRSNGVHLETTFEGRIDWSTSMGRVHDVILSEQNHDFSRRLASKVVDGKLNALASGFWPHGRIPYGYALQYFDGNTPKHICQRGEKSSRPKGWKGKLVIVEGEAATVRLIFDWFTTEDVSSRTIAHRLNTQNMPPPEGTFWHISTVVKVLVNPVYKGEIAIGVTPNSHPGAFARATRTSKVDPATVIVTEGVWQAAQDKRQQNRDTGRRVRNGSAGPLTGVLLCGHCGHRMARKAFPSGTVYVCVSPSLRPHLGCKQRRVRESAIVPAVCAELVTAVDWATLERARAKPPVEATADLDALAKRVADLDKVVNRRQRNLSDADPEDYDAMRELVRQARTEREAARNALALAKSPPADADRFTAWAESMKGKLVTLVPSLRLSFPGMVDGPFGMQMPGIVDESTEGLDTDVDTLRALLHKLNLTVTLWWRPKGPRNFSLERGLLRAEFGAVDLGGDTKNLCDPTGSTRG